MSIQIREDIEVFVSCAIECSQQIQLFGELFDEEKTVETVNFMPQTFSILKLALLRTVVIGVCAFFDPAETKGSENLSLPFLEKKYSDRITPEISELISKARTMYRSLNVSRYRSKYLAHRDVLHFTKVEKISHDLTTDDLQTLIILLMDIGLKVGRQSVTGRQLYESNRLNSSDSGSALIALLDASHRTV